MSHRIGRSVVHFGLLVALSTSALGQLVVVDKLRASGTTTGSWFGTSLDVHGTAAVIGTGGFFSGPPDDVYAFDQVSTGNWVETQRFPQSAPGVQFGTAVGVSATRLAIGAPGEGAGGAVWIFRRAANGTWVDETRLTPATGGGFGDELALTDDSILVRGNSGVHVFDRNAGGPNAWGQTGTIQVPGVNSFGRSLAVHGSTLIAAGFGRAFVYERPTGAPAWTLVRELATGPLNTISYGDDVAVHGKDLVVGDTGYFLMNSYFGPFTGVAQVYQRDAGGTNPWIQTHLIRPQNNFAFGFGEFVDIDAARLVATFRGNVKTNGQLRLFKSVPVSWGNDWVHVDTVYLGEGLQAVQLAARGDILVADPEGENFRGLVRVFRFADDRLIPDVLDAQARPSVGTTQKP